MGIYTTNVLNFDLFYTDKSMVEISHLELKLLYALVTKKKIQ